LTSTMRHFRYAEIVHASPGFLTPHRCVKWDVLRPMNHPSGPDGPALQGACSPVSLAGVGFALLLSKLFFRQLHLPWARLMQASGPGHEPGRAGIRRHEGSAGEIEKRGSGSAIGPRARPAACNAPCRSAKSMRVIGHDIDI
jgi:hypothetical protein